ARPRRPRAHRPAVDARRRVRRRGGRPGRRHGRRGGHRRRPDRRGGRLLARLRAPGGQGARPGVAPDRGGRPRVGRRSAGGVPVRHTAVELRPRAVAAIALTSLAGVFAFFWPLLISPDTGLSHSGDAPLVFAAILIGVLAVVLAEVSDGGLDTKAVAMLGVLSAVGAALRPLGAGSAGLETVFFLLILAGRVFGPGFGFVLGATTLAASALITAGVGPWLPFQMLAAAWVGLGAGLLPRAKGVTEVV